ncbi:TctA family transporter [Azospirillum agricola]|uniref:tripartite tricarboxylate transporter permease n=1 Tax=Azospirillum agricola TaxID=1720247 RepID=UPI001AEA817E|nr:tripartite tricarboxylate transporter permease [Azospirillum agricola]MBP2231927.1 TctA family transporter [Azospirillum agricola]
MTDLFANLGANLGLGLSVAASPQTVLWCLVGCLLGTLIGVLPGIGPVATIAMLLPVTFYLDPVSAIIMLAGIYYGAQYGGSTTAILMRLPGESSSVVTCLDGNAMARRGRAGAALAVAALSSFLAGTVATLLIALFSPSLTALAQSFGPAEYFSLMLLGMTGAVVLAHGSVPKAVAMVLLGLLLGLVGTDVESGMQRFTFGIPELADGIDFVPLAMGLFGLAEIIVNLERGVAKVDDVAAIGRLRPTREEMRAAVPAALRGTAVGSLLGLLPGGGAVLSAFAAYTLEKRLSPTPERFGTGAVEGVAAPEAANNAGAQTSFVPLLTLGIPETPVMALMVGAMMIHGIQPGPQVMTAQPALFWGLIASMWIGNLMLLVINLPLVGLWVRLLRVPYHLLFPAILLFCAIGVYSVHNSAFDVLLTALFGLVGYGLAKLKCEPAPLMLAFVLGPLMEENLRRALQLAHGDAGVFVRQPISLGLLLVTLALLLGAVLPAVRRVRAVAFAETDT